MNRRAELKALLRRPLRPVRSFVQRGRRGWSDEDVWSLNTHLAEVIAGLCERLAEQRHGCPSRLVESGDVDAGCDRWAEILWEIADGFRAFADADGVDFGLEPGASRRLDRSLTLLGEWFGDLWD